MALGGGSVQPPQVTVVQSPGDKYVERADVTASSAASDPGFVAVLAGVTAAYRRALQRVGTGTATGGEGGDISVTVGTGNTAAGGDLTLRAGESTAGEDCLEHAFRALSHHFLKPKIGFTGYSVQCSRARRPISS